MFTHAKRLQFEAKPERPDPVFARRLQEVIGGQYGEISVMSQYLFQGWNCRHPGKYKDLIMDTGVEEMGHVEMLATMVARLLEGRRWRPGGGHGVRPLDRGRHRRHEPPARDRHRLRRGPRDSNGVPWSGAFIIASGNLLADFYALWNFSSGQDSRQGGWASGPIPDGRAEFGYVEEAVPMAMEPMLPAGDPRLYNTGRVAHRPPARRLTGRR